MTDISDAQAGPDGSPTQESSRTTEFLNEVIYLRESYDSAQFDQSELSTSIEQLLEDLEKIAVTLESIEALHLDDSSNTPIKHHLITTIKGGFKQATTALGWVFNRQIGLQTDAEVINSVKKTINRTMHLLRINLEAGYFPGVDTGILSIREEES